MNKCIYLLVSEEPAATADNTRIGFNAIYDYRHNLKKWIEI